MYKIRRADTTDEAIDDLIRELHKTTFGRNAPMVNPFCHGDWWLAYDSHDTPVGFAGLHPADVKDEGYLKRCGVLPAYQGNGLQLKLIRVRERYARKLGYKCLISDTTNAIASSNNLIKAGYRLFIPKDPWGPKGALYWRKEL